MKCLDEIQSQDFAYIGILTIIVLAFEDGRRQTSLKGADPLLGAFVGLCMCLKQPLFIHSPTFEVQGSPLRRIAQTLVYYETSLKFTALLAYRKIFQNVKIG